MAKCTHSLKKYSHYLSRYEIKILMQRKVVNHRNGEKDFILAIFATLLRHCGIEYIIQILRKIGK